VSYHTLMYYQLAETAKNQHL